MCDRHVVGIYRGALSLTSAGLAAVKGGDQRMRLSAFMLFSITLTLLEGEAIETDICGQFVQFESTVNPTMQVLALSIL